MMIKFTNVFITISYAATRLYRENAEDRLLQGGNVSPVVPGAPGSQPGAFLPSVSSNYLFTQSHIVVDNLPPHLSVFSKPFFLQEGSSSMSEQKPLPPGWGSMRWPLRRVLSNPVLQPLVPLVHPGLGEGNSEFEVTVYGQFNQDTATTCKEWRVFPSAGEVEMEKLLKPASLTLIVPKQGALGLFKTPPKVLCHSPCTPLGQKFVKSLPANQQLLRIHKLISIFYTAGFKYFVKRDVLTVMCGEEELQHERISAVCNAVFGLAFTQDEVSHALLFQLHATCCTRQARLFTSVCAGCG